LPAGKSRPGRLLIEGVSYPHEVIARGVYARQLLQRTEKRNPGLNIAPPSASQQATDIDVVLGLLGLKRLQPARVQQALTATETPERRAALRKAGRITSFGESVAPHNRALSGLLDLGFQVFADPTLAAGKAFRTITLIDDAAKAAKVTAKAPAVIDALTSAIARQAERTALKGPVGDVRLLQRLVPSLKGRGATTELAAALASSPRPVRHRERGSLPPRRAARLLQAGYCGRGRGGCGSAWTAHTGSAWATAPREPCLATPPEPRWAQRFMLRLS